LKDIEDLKIGIFHATLPSEGRKLGGVEVFVDRLASALACRGCDVEVISLTAAPPGRLYKHRRLFQDWPVLHKSKFLRMYFLPLLLNVADLKRYDVVHFHGDDWAYLRRSIASVRTFHGSALWEARSAQSLKRKISQFIVFPLELLAGKLATLKLAVGAETKAIYHADGMSDLFATASVFHPGEKTTFPSLVFVGTWEGRKRGRLVAERFLTEIAPKYPEAKLFMACDFVPEAPGIIDLSSPSEEKLAKVFRESWMLVSASTYEGFGIPYLEALASGTVVVTTKNSGANYVLDNGKFGRIVEDGALGLSILELIGDERARQEYERSGLSRAIRFSESQVISDHLAHYAAAIRRFRTGKRNSED